MFNRAGLATATPSQIFFAFPFTFSGGVRVATALVGAADGLHRAVMVGAGPGGGPEVAFFDAASLQQLDAYFVAPLAFTGGVFVG